MWETFSGKVFLLLQIVIILIVARLLLYQLGVLPGYVPVIDDIVSFFLMVVREVTRWLSHKLNLGWSPF